jgi:hypothetical protein
MVQKESGLGNQQPSAVQAKVQRLGSNPVGPSGPKCLAPEMGEDIV